MLLLGDCLPTFDAVPIFASCHLQQPALFDTVMAFVRKKTLIRSDKLIHFYAMTHVVVILNVCFQKYLWRYLAFPVLGIQSNALAANLRL